MPDRPDNDRHKHPAAALKLTNWGEDGAATEPVCRAKPDAGYAYAELRCKSNFSFLRGASHPEELARRAAQLGYAALAITDRNTLAGVVRMHCAAKACNLKLIIGAELTPVDAPPVTLYAPDRASYGRLARIITQGRLRTIKGSCEVTLDDIAQWSDGLIAAVHGEGLQSFSSTHGNTPVRLVGLDGAADFSPHLLVRESLLAPIPNGNPFPCFVEFPNPRGLQVAARDVVHAYRDIFGDRLYLAVSVHGGPDDERQLLEMDALARATGMPMVATNDVHYHEPKRRFLQDVLTCIREHCTLEEVGRRLFANAERHLKGVEEMTRLFADFPHAITRTCEIADRCTFSLDELRYEYPEAICPKGTPPSQFLAELTWAGARERYPDTIPDKVRALIEHELRLIRTLKYEPYFLTVRDIVQFARSRGILCQGRGSAANSAVCYCLGITAVDPERIDLLFERFVSAERNEPPDIDVDFEHERREEVFQYIYGKYGREHAGIVAEVITYRPRSAIRDVGKVLGLSLDRIGALAKKHEWWDKEALREEAADEVGFDPGDRTVRMLGRLVKQLIGFPRHLSQHVGGFVITRRPLCEMVPIENGAMPERTFIEWDKDDIDALGILKIDCLALGMLTAIRKCFELIGEELRITNYKLRNDNDGDPLVRESLHPRVRESLLAPIFSGNPFPCFADSPNPRGSSRAAGFTPRGASIGDTTTTEFPFPRGLKPAARGSSFATPTPLSLNTIPPEDPAVYDMICRADTVGVFQIESRAQMSMLPRLKPRKYYDLVIEVAIVRPGPIQGGMVHPYLRRRSGEEGVTYPNEAIKEVLQKTLGVPLFQEQAMQLAVVAAAFTPGEADQLRRAMGAWRRRGVIDRFRTRLVEGMKARGLSQEFAEQCFEQISGFGEYGFPESHAASFALLVYVSAWLKRYHPAAFCAAIINSQPMGFYRPAQLVRDAREHGVTVLSVDVNFSGFDCRLEKNCPPPTIGNPQCTIRNPKSAMDNPARWGMDGPAVRLGMRLIKGISRAQIEGIERARRERSFTSVADLAYRSGVSRATLARLAAADAMGSLGLDRRKALWQVLALGDEPPLLKDAEPTEADPNLPDLSLRQTVYADYETEGLSLNAHPMSLIREELGALNVSQARVLRNAGQGQWIKVAGLVLVRQRPSTASGIVFCTLEDETGTANLVIRPNIFEKYRRETHGAVALMAKGRVERQGEVVHLQTFSLQDLSHTLADLRSTSRDFH